MLTAPKPQSSFEVIPAGSYVARLYSIIEIGTEFFEYMGEKKSSKKIRFTFELPTEMKVFKEENGEQPYVLSIEYGFSMHPKSKLRPMVENWLGKKFTDDDAYLFDIESLIGKECLLSVVHDSKGENTYANISNISPVPKGMKCPDPFNPPFSLNYQNWDQVAFDSLPDFIKDKMKKTPEFGLFSKTTDEEISVEEANELMKK